MIATLLLGFVTVSLLVFVLLILLAIASSWDDDGSDE